MKYRYMLLLLMPGVSTHVVAQQNIFKTYTEHDGLVSNHVRRVFQDSRGYIWIGTWEGLSKFDGHKFINYHSGNGLGFEVINDFYEDRDNKLYVAENNGNIDLIVNDRILRTGFDSIAVNRFIAGKDGRVTTITDDHGIVEFRNGRFSKPHTGQALLSVLDYARLNDSLLIVLDSDYKAIILDRNMQRFSPTPGGYFENAAIVTDSKQRVWLCSQKGLKLVDTVQHRDKPIRLLPLPALFDHPLLHGRTVHDLFEDINGNYWISTATGLIRISADGRGQLFTVNDGLPTNMVSDLFQDREKNIWMSSQLGLVKLVMQNDIQLLPKEIVPAIDHVTSIAPGPNSSFYFSCNSGIYVMDEKTFEPTRLVDGPFAFIATNANNNALLIIREGKLWEIREAGTKPRLLQDYRGQAFFSIASDKAGNFFFGSIKGLYHKPVNDTLRFLSFPYRITTLALNKKGELWVGTWHNGLYRVTPVRNKGKMEYRTQKMNSLVPDKEIRAIYVDSDGHIWIGTRYQGIYRLSDKGNNEWDKQVWTRDNGLSSNWINVFSEDASKNIWVGSHSGLNKLIPGTNGYRVFNFNRLTSVFGSVHAIHIGRNNTIWCGGYPGLVRLVDEQLDTLLPRPLFITTIKAGKDKSFSANEKIKLKYNENNVHFEFSAPSYINEGNVLYSYRLLGGADTSWSNPSNLNTVSYASIESGNYTFQVRTYGWNGQPGEIKNYAFTILPPYWKTWWFYILIGLAITFLLYGLYDYRIRQLMKWQRARDRIASDLHDDIGSSLTNISILSELSNKHLDEPQVASSFLQRISEEVHSSSQAMDDIIWSVNSQNDSFEETLARMRRLTAELFDCSEIQYHLQLDETVRGIRLNMEQRRDAFLLYKEILNNIYKHASARQAWISVKINGQRLQLQVRDDGRGFNVNMTTHRNGLKNIYSRAGKWNGKVEIASREGMGTEIKISLPLSQ